MKKDINKTILGFYKMGVDGWEDITVDNKIVDYVLTTAYTLECEYNQDNKTPIDVDFIEMLIDDKNVVINYIYGTGYTLTFETWDNLELLLDYTNEEK